MKLDPPAVSDQRAVRHEAMRKRPDTTMNAAFKRVKPGTLTGKILTLAGGTGNIGPGQETRARQSPSTGPGSSHQSSEHPLERQRITLRTGITLRPAGGSFGLLRVWPAAGRSSLPRPGAGS